jgi:hypothetical protein
MTAKRRWQRSLVEVALELGEDRRIAGTGAAKIGRVSRPLIGAGGRQRRRGFNGRHQCRVLKTPVTRGLKRGEGTI